MVLFPRLKRPPSTDDYGEDNLVRDDDAFRNTTRWNVVPLSDPTIRALESSISHSLAGEGRTLGR